MVGDWVYSSTKVESSFPPAMYPVLSQLRRWCHLDAECRVMLDNYDIRWVLPLLFLDIQIQIKTHIQIGKHIMRDNCNIRWVLLCWQTNCWWQLSLTRAILRSNEQMFHPHWGLWYTAKQGLSDHHHAEIQSLSSIFLLLLLQPFYNFVSKLCLQLFKLDPIFIYQIHFLVEVEGLERTVCLSGHATSGANRLPQTNTKWD